jgi:hypothetical protein
MDEVDSFKVSSKKIMENTIPPAAQTTTAPEANNNTATSKIISIREKLNIPPAGNNTGRFVDLSVLPEDRDQAGKARRFLRLDIQLKALDRSGQPFVVSKFYNLLGRGLEILNDDLRDWCGNDLIPEHANELDTSTFAGQPVVVELTNRKQGKKWQTTIESFHPVTAPAPVA